MIGDPTYADAILDRLVHNAYRLDLKGESMRGKAARRAAGSKAVDEIDE
jgi:DNA replication protein DnaC